MQDRQLYAQILGIAEPWWVEAVELRLDQGEVIVRLTRRASAPLVCPECGRNCPGYDQQARRWRHLDTCQFQTILEAPVPRCQCPEHGVLRRAVRRGLARRKVENAALLGVDEKSFQKGHEYVTVVSDLRPRSRPARRRQPHEGSPRRVLRRPHGRAEKRDRGGRDGHVPSLNSSSFAA